ncbi:hypothetical protein CU303_03955 [Prochlorococcus marinus str. MU1417]|nr:hypothetical protein [Prochlorococcus marinus str. MU1417]
MNILLKKNYLGSMYFRIFCYLVISIIYFIYMSEKSLLGIEWLDFFRKWVINIVNNINPDFDGFYFGFTSRDFINELGDEISNNRVYILPIYQNLHLKLLSLFGGENAIIFYGQLLDKIAVSLSGFLTGEIIYVLCITAEKFSRTLIAITSFSFFLTSPWSYRMLLAPWQEVYFLLFLLLAIFFVQRKRYKLALLSYTLAAFSQYQWSFILSCLFLISSLANRFSRKNRSQGLFLPNQLMKLKNLILLISIGLFPTFSLFLQKFLLNLSSNNFVYGGSNVMFRIGLDSPDNINHGGWLASFQFLGGNRVSSCLENINIDSLMSSMTSKIFLLNCLFSISGMVILSIISIIGYVKFSNANKTDRWFLMPIFLVFFTFCLVFQQSFAAHLQGYSYIFGFIYACGLVYFASFVFKRFFSFVPSLLLYIPFYFGVILTHIRVSFLTGLNG